MRDLPDSPVSAAATALGGGSGGSGGNPGKGGNPGPGGNLEGEVPPVEGFSANPFHTQQTRSKL